MGGQQPGGPCPPTQSHQVHTRNASGAHQSEYVPDDSGHRGHRLMQTGAYPLELLQLMGVEIPPLRRGGYSSMQGGGAPSASWQRRLSPTNNAPTMPPPHLNFRPANTGSIKKPNWNNKAGKRNAYRESFSQNEMYNSDSGFSSRSPTPNKHQADGSQTESSDERDSIASSAEQGIKRLHEVHPSTNHHGQPTNTGVQGLISSASAHQFYQSQRPVNYYHSTVPAPRSQVQNYQGKRRYHSGKNSPPPQRAQRGRRFSGVLLPNYSMFPRYYIAPDRFLARSHLIQVTHVPKDLLNGSHWDDLSRDVWEKFMSNQQTETTYRNKMMLWKYLYIYIKSTFPKYGLFLVGSTMNGFGSDNSDVDMCLLVRHTEMDQRNEAIGHLEQILKCLKKCDFIEQLELIQAKVPILKFHDSMQNLEVDLNCNNAVGIRNTHLLYCYSQVDWRVRPLVLVIKLWAQFQDINDAKNMTISSYSLVLMVIHFLQCGVTPAVLPCLHSLYDGKFGPSTDIHLIDIHEDLDISVMSSLPLNRQSLGELLLSFFKYYVSFDFSMFAISVRLADKVAIEECRRVRSFKNDPHQWKYLCIEEPFDLTNTARSVYDPDVFSRIKRVFARSYQKLKESQDLASIFVKFEPTT
ncbi:poly(A) RNA polymerase gld-2 homolog A isoform X3 [Cephus cinctus]|nr:poly(A) RNA polymerase gld-2 homolog A isoform X3 [Cephus cinctus]XP_015599028.1 poly(A) RNA polymerase gld-2 homolog A isoform X3 [Cephus cinctus]XP_024942611.1 poly(A) RNA polymerase gld-2 homolog A isoform X3 [Cephus cinctus]